jgi:uncharacterized cysteine cluster protein YcgN (CxxCxxCC family)
MKDFWRHVPLKEMTTEQWESLCDGCGKCCLHKLEDEDDGGVYYTKVACRLLDCDTARCSDYENRKQKVPGCTTLDPENIEAFFWMPSTCAYRRLAEGLPLPKWHPLRTGDPASTRRQNRSIAGLCVSEQDVAEEDYELHIVNWVQ